MLRLPSCVVTAVLATAVHASTHSNMLPRLACNGPSSIGQAVMGMHTPTTIAPAVLLPHWQGSELRLHKRAPVGMYAVEEEVDLEKRNIGVKTLGKPSRKPPKYGKHDPSMTVPREISDGPPLRPKEVIQRKGEAKGKPDEQHNLGFLWETSVQTHVVAPLKIEKVRVSHQVKEIAAKVVGLVHKGLAKKIHDPAKTSLKEKIEKEEEKHRTEMDAIHAHYNAERPSVYQIGDRQLNPKSHRSGPVQTHYYKPAATGHVQHHESDHHAPPHYHGTPVPSVPSLRHDSGYLRNYYREGTHAHHSDMW